MIRDAEAVVYWVDAGGELMLAPDVKMSPFPGWHRVECKTTSEIENFSRRMAKQEWQKFRSMKVQEHIRYRNHREQLRTNCLLRLAKGCISAADEYATRMTLHNLDAKDEALYKLLSTEPDLSRASLEIEKFDAQTIKQRRNGKRPGIKDEDVNPVHQLIEGVR